MNAITALIIIIAFCAGIFIGFCIGGLLGTTIAYRGEMNSFDD